MKSADYTSWQLVKDIWIYIQNYRYKFWLGFVLRATSDLAWLYPAYALASIVNFFINRTPGQSLDDFWNIMIIWGILSVYHYITRDWSRYFGYQVAENTAQDVMLKTTRHLLNLDLAWQEKENTGNKAKRIQKGGEGFDSIIRMFFDYFVNMCVRFVGILFIISQFDSTIAWLVLIFMCSYFGFSYFLTKKTAHSAHRVNMQDEVVAGLSFETINNIQTVKVLRMHDGLLRALQVKIRELVRRIKYRIFCFRVRGGLLATWGLTFRLGIMILICLGVANGKYEVGFIMLFYKYFDDIWESVSMLSDSINEFMVSKYGIHRMMDILNEPIRIASDEGKINFEKGWKEIVVKNLTFKYDKHKVLKNLTFSIKRGEKIGIVGLSGGGKSTLFKLLLKQREKYTGQVLFDGQELKTIKKSDYLKHIAIVPQDTELFNMSLEKNILLAASSGKKSKKKLEDALKIAHIPDFLHKLPQGTKTLIGEKGIKLSGGEKQRLGIARAVYRNPEILFLDEATSHLDIESEQKIQDSLHKFFQKVTAVVIAHRLSTIKEMDRILVLEDGRIAEEGAFDALIKRKGRFYDLWKRQKFM